MINYWWVTRPKRKLDSVPDVLRTFVSAALDRTWAGQRESHNAYEAILEQAGLKKVGVRQDQTGGGARTYKAWLVSLGLIYVQNSTGEIKLTEAGDFVVNEIEPPKVISEQVLKFQYPSVFSLGRGVQLAARYKVHPFFVLLSLLANEQVSFLTEEEIAKIVIVEGEKDSREYLARLISRIMEFRNYGDDCLEKDFFLRYQSSKGGINMEHPYSHLMDVANTLTNWLNYTGLIQKTNGIITIAEDKWQTVNKVLACPMSFIDHPEDSDYFQTQYGKIQGLF